jgi:RimJ/RimL family protein N-acetyltransferase
MKLRENTTTDDQAADPRRPARVICGLAEDCVIDTARLRLRPCRVADAANVHAIFADWEVVRWLGAPSWPQPFGETLAYIENVIAGYVQVPERYLIIEHEGRVVGGIGVREHPANHLQRAPGPHIGYWLGRAFWNRGFMTEAAAGVIGRVFGETDAPAIYSGVFEGNGASLRVQDKLGFARDGTTTLACNPQGGIELPHINTMLTRERFEAPA